MAYYGSLPGVAALSKQFTDDGEFTDGDCLNCLQVEETNPTKSEVVTWLDQVSAAMNNALAGEGFVVPVTHANSVKMIDMIVNQYVADLVKYANNNGRFATERARESGIEPMITIYKNILSWANSNAPGMAGAGAPRGSAPGDRIATKTNSAIFSRKAFGNIFQDWDKNND